MWNRRERPHSDEVYLKKKKTIAHFGLFRAGPEKNEEWMLVGKEFLFGVIQMS